MNYIELLKQHNRVLVINGPEGAGKTVLAQQLASSVDSEYAHITPDRLMGHFSEWLHPEPTVVIVEMETCDVGDKRYINEVFDKVKSAALHEKSMVNRKGHAPYTIDTPFFIVITNIGRELYDDLSRRFIIINLEGLL